MTAPGDTTRLGYFLGPHGVQGGVKVYVLGDAAQVMRLPRVYVEGRGWLRVRRADALAPGVALHLAGISTREGAEALRGLNVYAADQDLPALEEGRFYYHQLRGLAVQDSTGQELGEVTDVLDTGHQDLLVVRHLGGEGFLPLQAPYVDIQMGRGPQASQPVRVVLTDDAPAGLLGDAEEMDLTPQDSPAEERTDDPTSGPTGEVR